MWSVYHFPGMPTDVAIAYSSLLVLGLGFACSYLVADER